RGWRPRGRKFPYLERGGARLLALDPDPESASERHPRHAQDREAPGRGAGSDRGAPDDVRRAVLRPPPGRRRAGRHLPRAREGAPRGSGAAPPRRLMADRFDLVVVGSGPAGYTGAIRAAQLGMQVACVEKDPPPGGTCLNVGRIPSQALRDSTEPFHHVRHGLGTHGVHAAEISLDLPAMQARKDKIVHGLTQGIAGLFRKNKITRVTGTARLAAANRVAVRGSNGEIVLEATHVLIA